jgi:hypothetical protein
MPLDKIVVVTEMGRTDKIVFYDTIQAQLTNTRHCNERSNKPKNVI